MTSIRKEKKKKQTGNSKDGNLLKGTVFKEKTYRTHYLELELNDELLKYYLNLSCVNKSTAM